ncbi:MAG: nusB [Gammaproteobacteria bacterium]|jgi:N utilization substance protein B|nr:nusB [Gammaproteobacteria bacterium]
MLVKPSPSARRNARKLALQGIYQWQVTHVPPALIEAQLLEEKSLTKIDVPYFREVLKGVCEEIDNLDEKIEPALDRPLIEVSSIERAVLRLAVYEFLYRIDIPYRVVIDEALRLSKVFGTTEGFKYVNGVLDKVAPSIRALECQTRGGGG